MEASAADSVPGTQVKRFKMWLRAQQERDVWRLTDPLPNAIGGHTTVGPAATSLVRQLHEGRRRKWADRAGNPLED